MRVVLLRKARWVGDVARVGDGRGANDLTYTKLECNLFCQNYLNTSTTTAKTRQV